MSRILAAIGQRLVDIQSRVRSSRLVAVVVVTTAGDSPRSRSKVQRPEARALDLRLADLYCRGGAFVHLDGLWWCLCGVNGAVRSAYALVSSPSPLLPKTSALVLRRAPKRADLDQPNALSLCSVKG